ncbi:hypothetical protein BP5796_04226 [Coleophoma crateriformis]|uniref:beta-glucosidase n=1 Tax=Coleophoma crateriformis TaxID=565419 RepID=A0A3D8SI96_9HELO|nr:hypothetical protein BP5796_04226 [Coleophoma crateriformis]
MCPVSLDTVDLSAKTSCTAFRDGRGNHSTLIRQIGGESMALLKKDNSNGGGLPLKKPHTISLFGAHASPAVSGPNYGWSVGGTGADVFQGHLALGGGSGETSLPYLVTPFNSLTQRAIEDNSMIWWITNNTFSSSSSGNSFGLASGTGVAPSFTEYASNSDRAVQHRAGRPSEHGSWLLQQHRRGRQRVRPGLEAWIENDNVTAVIYGGLLGQESGNAIADMLYGDTTECAFSEGVYIDYRWFDKQAIEPRFPFGHGLSYTNFTCATVTATITNSTALSSNLGGLADLFDEVTTVNTTVQNSGSLDGAEVAQLYVSFPDEAAQPVRVLHGFEKVNITTGATSSVSFSLRRRDVSYWDVAAQNWAVASGTYTFGVGSSSRDIRGNATLTISARSVVSPCGKSG